MRRTKQVGPWVVYQMSVHGHLQAGNSVCDQSEWEAMELTHPGTHVLVRGGIATEEEAEKLARGKAGDPVARQVKKKPDAGPPMEIGNDS